jgi:hypothetical protein
MFDRNPALFFRCRAGGRRFDNAGESDSTCGKGLAPPEDSNPSVLKAGTHKVFVMIPEDSVVVEKELRLKDGTRNDLILEPVYATGNRIGNVYVTATGKRIGKRSPNFYSHLSGVRMLMNGKLQ